MDPEVHRARNGAAGENRVRKLGSVLTLDIFQKGQATRRISIVRTDPFSSSCDIAKLPRSTEKSLCDIAKPSRSTGNVPVILGNRSDTSGKHFRGYLGQAARSFAAMSLYSASDSFLLGAGVPGAFPPKEGMT